MREFDAYLFDADGTIIDTRELIYRSFMHAGECLGVVMPHRDLIEGTVGMVLDSQFLAILGTGHPDEFFRRAKDTYGTYMMEHFREHLGTFPGCAAVLRELCRRGKKLAVVTSRKRPSLEVFLKYLGLDDFFSVLVTAEDTERHKPEPDPGLLAAEKLGVDPSRAVFIGDAIFDIKCGWSAGMATAFVEWGGMDPKDWDPRPDFIARQFGDLLPDSNQQS